jgi:hypothetical protein
VSRSFNGTNQYLRHSADIVGSFPLTIACWFDSNNITANQTIIGLYNSANANRYIRLFAGGANSGDPLTMQINDGTVTNDEAGGYSANVWQHACGTIDSSNIEAFLDGVSDGSTSNTRSYPSGIDRITLGVRDSGSQIQFFNGELGEAGVWNVVLTQAEIDSLATGVSPLLIRPSSLIAYWPLIGRTSPEIDIVGGFDQTVTGATQAAHPRVIQPSAQIIQFPTAAGISSTLTGTITATIDESDLVTGGNTVVLTLTGDTFVTGTTSEDGIAAGSDSDKTGANKWDALIKTDLDNTDVVLSVGDTVATITLPAYASYDTDEQETITWTIPAASLTTSASPIVASPTFTVDEVVSGRIMSSLANRGGLAGFGGIAGQGGGLAG